MAPGGMLPGCRTSPPRQLAAFPDELWDALRARADERGETVSAVVLRALRAYLRDYDG